MLSSSIKPQIKLNNIANRLVGIIISLNYMDGCVTLVLVHENIDKLKLEHKHKWFVIATLGPILEFQPSRKSC